MPTAKGDISIDGIPELQRELDAIIKAYCQEVEFSLYATADYAIYVERGTYRMGAQPFLGPGIEAGMRGFDSIARRNQGSTESILGAIMNESLNTAYRLCPVDTGYLRSTIAFERTK